MVSMATNLRGELIPVQALFSQILNRAVPGVVREDNDACIVAAKKGYSPALRHLPRMQRTSIGFVHDVFAGVGDTTAGVIELERAESKDQKGDSFTKELSPATFNAAVRQYGMKVFPPGRKAT